MKKEEDKWIQNFRKCMEEYSEPLPPEGWEKLENALSPSSEGISLWSTSRFLAIAAVFVVVVSSLSIWLVGLSLENTEKLSLAMDGENMSNKFQKSLSGEEKLNKCGEYLSPLQGMSSVTVEKMDIQKVVKPVFPLVVSEFSGEEELRMDSLPDLVKITSDARRNKRGEDKKIMERNREVMWYADKKRSAAEWSLGVHAGNMPYGISDTYVGFTGMTMGKYALPVDGNALAATNSVNSAYKQVLFNNRDKETWTDAHHKMPVTVGASVKWNFARKWALETGFCYSFLESEFRSGSDISYWKKVQKLHYVGIPLKLHFRLWENRRGVIYVAAGGMIEKCVSGSEDILVAESAQMQMSEQHSLKVNPVQWSVAATAGAQVNVTRWLGIYLEPGVAYYFNDGSQVETIRKEHPLNFTLQMGIRFSFPKK